MQALGVEKIDEDLALVSRERFAIHGDGGRGRRAGLARDFHAVRNYGKHRHSGHHDDRAADAARRLGPDAGQSGQQQHHAIGDKERRPYYALHPGKATALQPAERVVIDGEVHQEDEQQHSREPGAPAAKTRHQNQNARDRLGDAEQQRGG